MKRKKINKKKVSFKKKKYCEHFSGRVCSIIGRELKQATFLSHGRKPEVNILHARTAVPPRFSN